MGRPLRTGDAVWAAAGLAVIVALPSLMNGFTYDDVWIVSANPAVREPSGLFRLLTATYWPATEGHGALWRPLTLAAFALQWLLGGGTPLVFHAVAVVMTGVAAGLVAALAGRLFGPVTALTGGLLFAVHPVHVEVTATVVGQAELWAAIAYLGAMLAAWQVCVSASARERAAWITAIGIAVTLGLGAKEHVVTIPMAIGLVWWRYATAVGRPLAVVAREQAAAAVVVLGVLAGYLVARAAVLGGVAGVGGVATGLDPASPWRRIAVMLPVSLRWLELLFVPWRLSADYSPQHLVPDASLSAIHGVAIFAWLGLAALLWRGRARLPAAAFGGSLFAITIAIVANVVVPLEVLLAERLLFLPSVGWAIAVGGVVALGAASSARRWLVPGVVLVVLAFGARSVARAGVWRSNETLFAQMLREAPKSYRTHWALGAQAFARGDSADGEREWRDAIRLNPAHPQPLEDLGRLYARTGRWSAAVPLLERVIQLDSTRVGSALALGTGYTRLGRLDDAVAYLERMELRHPSEAMFPALRADVHRRREEYGAAADAADAALARDSTQWQLWLLAAETAALAGRCDAAASLAEEARRRGGAEGAEAMARMLSRAANRKVSCN